MKLLDLIKKIDKEKELEEILIEGFRLVLTEDNCKVLSKARKSFNKSLFKILEHIVGEGEEELRECKMYAIDCDKMGMEEGKHIISGKVGGIIGIIEPLKEVLEEYKGRDKNI